MKLLIKGKKIQKILFFFSFIIIIILLNKKSNPNSYKNISFNIRNLISNNNVDERCKKTSKNFLDKYNISKYSIIEDKPLTKYQITLKDIVIDKKYEKIKDYLLRIIIYLSFLVFDIFLIIVWFSLWGCCCCKNKKSFANGFSKCFYFLFIFFSIISILISVCGFIIIPCFYQSTNDIVCSLYKMVFHFIEGTKNDVPQSHWKGVEGINNIINIYNHTNKIYKELPIMDETKKDCIDEEEFCYIYEKFRNQVKINDNKEFMDGILEAQKYIKNITAMFIDIKDDKLENIEKIMEYFDNYYKLGLLFLFSVILAFCLFSFLTLTLYFICKCVYISCLFHLFWNIEMIIIIITLFVGICFGISGVINKDIVSILKYIVSGDNLKLEKPLFFDTNNNKKELDICFNGDGDLSKFAFKLDKYFDESNNKTYHEFEVEYSKIKKKEILKLKAQLYKAYESLYEVIKNLKDLYDDLNENNLKRIFNCEFIKLDFNIMISELNNSLSKILILMSLIIIISDLFAFLSILFGVLIVTNYTVQNKDNTSKNRQVNIKYKGKKNKRNIDSSIENLKK